MLWFICFLGLFISALLLIIGKMGHWRVFRVIAVLGGIGLFLWSIPCGYIVCCSIAADMHNRVPANVFKDVFETPPPPDVTDLRADAGYNLEFLGGSEWAYLRFHIAPKAFRSLIADRWKPSAKRNETADRIAYLTQSGPDWWKPAQDNTIQMFELPQSNDYTYPETALLYDPKTGTAYYGFRLVD